MRLRTRFVILFFAVALLPLTLVGAIAYSNGRQAIEASLGLLFEQRANRSIEALDREIQAQLAGAQAWAGLERMQDVLGDDREGRIAAFLIEEVRRAPTLARALVKGPGGVVVAASHPDWIGRVEVLGGAGLDGHEAGHACRDDESGDAGPLLTCEFPIRAAFDESRHLGSLSVTWNTTRLLGRVRLDRPPAGQGELLLLDRSGQVLSSPTRFQVGAPGRSLVQSGSRAASMAAGGRSGFLVERLDGGEYLVGYAHSSGPLGWSVLVAQDVGTAFAPTYRLGRIVLGVGALAGVISLLLATFVARRTARPLLAIEEAARRVAGGDLGTRLEVRAGGEVGSLADSFDRMVSELRRQRQQLVEKDFVDSVLSHMLDGLLVVDADGVVERVNRALVEMLASREERVVGRRAGSLFHDGFDAFQERVLGIALRGEPAREVELELGAEDGRRVPVMLSAALLPPARLARPLVACLVADISQRKHSEIAMVKARELAEAAARAKAQFLATVSHEIRTPLNGIIGMTELLAGTRLSSQQREYADTARRSSEVLLSVLNDILDFSKMDAGRLELESIPFDLRSCVEGAADILSSKAREKDVELALRLHPDLPDRVHGDPARLRQVLLNLGGNAVKFTAKGEIVIGVSPEPGRRGRVRFRVSDTGVGIPTALRSRLFQPFFQADASTTRRYGGTGLGLAIAKRVVDLMGGEIGFESEEGRGSTFHFVVDLPAVEGAAGAPEPRRGRLFGLRVLVVDDNATNRYVLRELLGGWGCVVGEAPDAWEGLEKLRAAAGGPEAYQLAVIDFQMPEMDGGQLAREIKRDPRLASTPLILVTSMPQHGDAAQMMDMGFSAYLTKPVKQAVLHEVVASVMGGVETPRRSRLKLVTAHTVGEEVRSRRRILLVADSVARQKAALRALEECGYACDLAGGGEEAVRAVANGSYDLVLMECAMPGVDGYEAARQIRAQEGEGPRVPIVAMGAAESDGEAWREAGMDESIGGPADAADLRRIAERFAPSASAGATEPVN